LTVAVAVPSDSPQLALVEVRETTKDAGASVIVTLASSEHEVPAIDTVTVYEPPANPDAWGPVCPLDQMKSYEPGRSTVAVAVPFDNPHPDMVDVMETEKETGMSDTMTLATCVHVVPGFDMVTLYDPAATDVILDPLCPLDHAYWY
jgi:hypothetical protein